MASTTANELHRDVTAVTVALAADLERECKEPTEDNKKILEERQAKLEEQLKMINELQEKFLSDLDTLPADLASEKVMDLKLDRLMNLVKEFTMVHGKTFLEKRKDQRYLDHPFTTGLHLAAINGLTTTVQTLLLAGARADALDKDGCTSLFLACENKHEAAAAELMEATKNAGALDLLVSEACSRSVV